MTVGHTAQTPAISQRRGLSEVVLHVAEGGDVGETVPQQRPRQTRLLLGQETLGQLGPALAQPGARPADEGVLDGGLGRPLDGLRRPEQPACPRDRQAGEGADRRAVHGRHQDPGRVQLALTHQVQGVGDARVPFGVGDVPEDQAKRRLQLLRSGRRDGGRRSHVSPLQLEKQPSRL